jgi:hypothetical protein
MTAHGRNRISLAAGGVLRVTDYAQTKDGKVTFSGHGVMSWDPESGLYHLFWFDSRSAAPKVFRGGFEGAEDALGALILTGPGNEGGFERLREEFLDERTMRASAESSPDGEEWRHEFEAIYRRVD